jgi:hypothetical protein
MEWTRSRGICDWCRNRILGCSAFGLFLGSAISFGPGIFLFEEKIKKREFGTML